MSSPGYPGRLEVVDGFTGPDPPQDLLLFGKELRRDDQPDRLAEGLPLRVTEQALGGPVPRHDPSLGIHAQDGIVGGRDDGGEIGVGV